MKLISKIFLGLLALLIVLATIKYAIADYTPEVYGSVDLVLNGSYTPEVYGSVDLVLGGTSTAVDNCDCVGADTNWNVTDECVVDYCEMQGGNLTIDSSVTTFNITGELNTSDLDHPGTGTIWINGTATLCVSITC